MPDTSKTSLPAARAHARAKTKRSKTKRSKTKRNKTQHFKTKRFKTARLKTSGRRMPKGILPLQPSCGRPKPVIMVCSTVYGQQRLLNTLDRQLTAWGYEVVMSHRGKIPVDCGLSNTDNCLRSLEGADGVVFLITPRYGSSGTVEKSITHKELDYAIKLGKRLWVLADHRVVAARGLLKKLEKAFGKAQQGHPEGKVSRWRPEHLVLLEKMELVEDHRVITMYDTACREEKPFPERVGNWVQAYRTVADVLRFLAAQLAPRRRA